MSGINSIRSFLSVLLLALAVFPLNSPAAALAANGAEANTALPFVCGSKPTALQAACRDSVFSARAADSSQVRQSAPTSGPQALREIQARQAAKNDSLVLSDTTDQQDITQERYQGYFGNLVVDLQDSHWDLDGGDWAAVIYVVVGVVVVSAAIVGGPYLLFQLLSNQDHDPVFHEVSLRYSYSGKTWSDGGPPLYRDANLLGLHYGVGLDKNGFGLGLAVEGGYIDLALRGLNRPDPVFDFQGGYLVAGPMIRFGSNRPASFTLEFLNGTSDHASIGWISKSRMTLQGRPFASGFLIGAHLGAVFYDLNFYDGLVQRRGDFNRDLSLILGLDTGWEF